MRFKSKRESDLRPEVVTGTQAKRSHGQGPAFAQVPDIRSDIVQSPWDNTHTIHTESYSIAQTHVLQADADGDRSCSHASCGALLNCNRLLARSQKRTRLTVPRFGPARYWVRTSDPYRVKVVLYH